MALKLSFCLGAGEGVHIMQHDKRERRPSKKNSAICICSQWNWTISLNGSSGIASKCVWAITHPELLYFYAFQFFHRHVLLKWQCPISGQDDKKGQYLVVFMAMGVGNMWTSTITSGYPQNATFLQQVTRRSMHSYNVYITLCFSILRVAKDIW